MAHSDPSRPVADHSDVRQLLGADLPDDLVDRIALRSDGLIWVTAATDADTQRLVDCECTEARIVLQLRCPLPLDSPGCDPAPTRPFQPGRDDEAFLAVNHRAFEWHPEQGDLDAAGLAERLSASWFSAEGFLLHTSPAGDIDGYCWTKVHPTSATDPALGEIYVIACDPAAQGQGLGRRLVVAGLEHLASQQDNGRPVGLGMLYVESTNEAALRLYDSLGFTLHHRDVAFAPPIEAAAR